jgi:uncharacterized protein
MTVRVSSWLHNLHPVWFVLIGWLASFVVVVPYAIIAELFPSLRNTGGINLASKGLVERVIVACLVAPLLETAMHQWAPHHVLHVLWNVPLPWVLLLSAAFFGAIHFYSLGYVVFAFLIGFILAHAFAMKHGSAHNPFWLVFWIHPLRNAVAVFLA